VIAKKDVELLEKSAVKLTLTVASADIKSNYDELVKKYSKQAQIPGFRKGKVPANVLISKFGESLKAETLHTVIDEALKEAFDTVEEKPLPYAQPELVDENLDLELEKDLTFTVKYDTFPKIELGEYKGIEVEAPVLSILKKDEEAELKKIQEQQAVVMDKANGTVRNDNIVTIDFAELDEEGNVKEDTKREGFVFTVGTGYNLYKIDEDLVGKKKDQEFKIEKEYPEDFEYSELAGKKITLQVKITAVKEKQLPEVNDELAQDISDDFETLEDLKKDLKEKMKANGEEKLKSQKLEQLMATLVENTPIDVPDSMVQAELENSWNNFAGQTKMSPEQLAGFLAADGKSKEDLLKEWEPNAIRGLKERLILGRIIENEKIEATEEEIDAEIANQAKAANLPLEQAKEYFANPQMKDYIVHGITDKKVVDFLLDNATVKKGKKIKYLDLMEGKQ